MPKAIGNIPTDQKVEIIFSYLFSEKKSEEEEFFWNALNKNEVIELSKIRKEETDPLSSLS